MISIRVINTASARLAKIHRAAKNPRQVLLAAGRAVANLLRKHFAEKNTLEPNKLGGKRTNFWLQVKRSVSAPLAKSPTSVVVAIAHPAMAQKVRGGTITPKRRKFLTIPVTAEAYGRTASTFTAETGQALVAVVQRGMGFLASKDGAGHLTVQYLLRRSVTQKPDPTALPSNDRMQRAALDAAALALRIQLARS